MNVGEHYRPTDADYAPGVYRVVGTTDDVALLRVGDTGGRRIYTGEVRHVDRTTLNSGFEATTDPDAGLSLAGAVRNTAQGLYWSVRRFLP